MKGVWEIPKKTDLITLRTHIRAQCYDHAQHSTQLKRQLTEILGKQIICNSYQSTMMSVLPMMRTYFV